MLRKNNKRMPDVLDCLANLSNDEVFTPPEIANRMLDLLPQELFESKETTFLDPFTKSGVFLREITKRLLSHQIPNYEEMSGEIDEIEKTAIQEAVKSGNLDLQDADYDEKAKKIGRDAISIHPRVGEFHEFEEKLQKELNRILKTQVFGIAITELTAQLTRRSLYCSKNAAGKYSIGTEFDNEDGNIRFKSCQHVWDKKPKWIELDKKWKGGTCIFCGASSEMFDRPNDLEQHAYEFIHTPNAKELFNMKFTVVCGNPPYQLETAGDENGAQAKPIYHKFVEQAIRLNPQYLSMIIPSRWFSGGWGLDDFRNMMMNSNKIVEIHDYQNSKECFPGVEIKGGVSYFLWENNANKKCKFVQHEGEKQTITTRYLKEDGCDIVIRYNNLISVFRKVAELKEPTFNDIVSGRSPFGFNTNHYGTDKPVDENDNVLYFERKGIKNMPKSSVTRNADAIDKWKLFTPKAAEDGTLPSKVLGKMTIGNPNMICSGTYLMVGPFDSEEEMMNVKSYMETKFFRALVSIYKISQNASQNVYVGVPMQDFSKPWTDDELYKKYNLTQDEIDFIESMIKPMSEVEDK